MSGRTKRLRTNSVQSVLLFGNASVERVECYVIGRPFAAQNWMFDKERTRRVKRLQFRKSRNFLFVRFEEITL
jgi:hypothetical protein